jgi:hypothetical protein
MMSDIVINDQPAGGSITAADITDSTATGRDVLTGDPAQGRTALSVYSAAETDAAIAAGGAGTKITPTFESGQGWTFVASSPAGGSASFETVGGAPVGRLSITGTAEFHGITGPRIERAFPSGVEIYKATVRLRSLTYSGPVFIGLYFRDAGSAVVIFANPEGKVYRETPPWNIDGPGPAGEVTFDSTCFLGLRGSRSSIRSGSINAAGAWTARGALFYFEPTHCGVILLCDGPQTGSADVDQFTLETFG